MGMSAEDFLESCKAPWAKITPEQAEYNLCVLPPIYFKGGFFVSEACYHDERGKAAYTATVTIDGQNYSKVVVRDQIAREVEELKAMIAAGTA